MLLPKKTASFIFIGNDGCSSQESKKRPFSSGVLQHLSYEDSEDLSYLEKLILSALL